MGRGGLSEMSDLYRLQSISRKLNFETDDHLIEKP
jgi:hypothetical protein